jgi:ABC-type branched-subunit amino acid transport system permease subunit
MLYAGGLPLDGGDGGENGFGGVTRWAVLDDPRLFYALVAVVAFGVVWRCGGSTLRRSGTVLVAIRENEQRARFVGYDTDRYKLLAFVISATVTASPACWRCSTTASLRPIRFPSPSPASCWRWW